MLAERAASDGPRSTRAVEGSSSPPAWKAERGLSGNDNRSMRAVVITPMSLPCSVGRRESMNRLRVRGHGVVVLLMCLSLVACAGPEPLLRSNAKFQLQGRAAAKLDVAACQQKVEASGLKPGTGNRSGNVAAGAGLGLISGAAVGASSGLIGGVPGVTIGAAVGGALGVIIGSVGGAYRPLEPDPPYADAVVRCLIEKGYDVSGWQ